MELAPKRDTPKALELVGVAAYDGPIARFNKWNKGRLVTFERIADYWQVAKGQYAPSSLNVIKFALKKAVGASIHTDSVSFQQQLDRAFKSLKAPRIRRGITSKDYLTEKEARIFLSQAPVKVALFAKFLLVTGLRVTAAIEIKLKDCRKVKGKMIEISTVGKGDKAHKVSISQKFFSEIEETFGSSKFLFTNNRRNKYSRRYWWKAFNTYGERILGIDNLHPHSFRHSSAMLLKARGQSVKAIASQLNHASTAITADYYLSDSVSNETILTLEGIA